jgi:hypothetical protein
MAPRNVGLSGRRALSGPRLVPPGNAGSGEIAFADDPRDSAHTSIWRPLKASSGSRTARSLSVSRHAVCVGGLYGRAVFRRSGRDAGERSGTDPDVDELELLYRRVGRHLGEPGRGEHSMDGGFEALVVEALPVRL